MIFCLYPEMISDMEDVLAYLLHRLVSFKLSLLRTYYTLQTGVYRLSLKGSFGWFGSFGLTFKNVFSVMHCLNLWVA